MTHRLRGWTPVLLWAAAILVLTSVPSPGVRTPSGADKLVHLAVYGVLGVLLGRARAPGPASAAGVGALGVAFAAVDELHQRWIPGRTADPADWAADALGVAAGLLLHSRLSAPRGERLPTDR